MSSLTPEQRARIEENRRIALQRLAERKSLQFNNPDPVNQQQSFSPKAPPAWQAAAKNNRPNPYLKPNSPLKLNNNNVNSAMQTNNQPSTSTSANGVQKPKKPIKIIIELMDDRRFLVKTLGYEECIIKEFKKVPSRSYNQATKHWSFLYNDYDQIIKSLEQMKPMVTIDTVPDFVLRQMRKETPHIDESCLDQIEYTLASTLVDFQRSGVAFGVSRNGRCLLADDMGLGKTRQALAIADFYRTDWPLLIVTTASTRHFWHKEISELLPNIPVHYISIIQQSSDFLGDSQVVICSYAGLEGNIFNLVNKKFGAIIFDESHHLKNPKAKQTKNAQEIAKAAKRVIMVTGTPALSRPFELFVQLDILDSKFATFNQFTIRYCNGRNTKFGWDASGATHLEELNILLNKKFMIRRIKGDVYMELTAKQRQLVILKNMKISTEDHDEFEQLQSQYNHAETVNKKDAEKFLMSMYHNTGRTKAAAACTFIEKFLRDHDGKVLAFAHHAVMMNALCAHMEKINVDYVKIDGGVTGDLRAERIQCFQTNSNIRVAILSIRACNAGITLTAASNVIFCELDWNPSSIVQAEARAHRIGQENQVKVYFLLAQGTADDLIWRLLQEKQKKLGKAGLVADIEHLSKNIQTIDFDLDKLDESSSATDSFYSCQTSVSTKPEEKIDYFGDDDEDEEFLKSIENLP